MSRPTKVPGIPKPPADVTPGLRGWLTSVAEALEIRLGRRGDPRDRAVTLRELIESGLAKDLAARNFDPNNFDGSDTGIGPVTEPPDTSVPPAPTSISVAPAYSQIIISWDYPTYSNHSFTEIYGHSSNVIGDAQLIGVTTGRVYIDPVGESFTRYYWIRHVSTSGVLGPFNSGTGTSATTAANVDDLLGELVGSIPAVAFATGIEPISVVNSLPSTSGYSGPSVVLLTSDGKLYRFVNGAWTAAVPTTDLSGTISSLQLANDAVTNAKLAVNAITADVIAANAITETKISNDAISSAKISAGAITAGKIGAGAVTAAKIDANAVTASKINAGAITSAKIDAGAITAAKIATDAITANKIAADAVTSNKIQAGAVQAGAIAAGAINATNIIADNMILADAIAANAITTAKIEAQAITGAKIDAGTITSGHIATNTIDASKIKLDGSTITSNSSGQIVIGSIAANSITSGTLDASNVTIIDLYADNITGDINQLIPFSLPSAVQIGGGDTQVWAGQFPSQSKPKKPYVSAVGFGNWENDVVYLIKLQMKANVSTTSTSLGSIVFAGFFSLFGSYVSYRVEVSGDKQNLITAGGELKIGGSLKGTVNSTTYDTTSNRTKIFYTPVGTAMNSTHVGSTLTTNPFSGYQTVSRSMFRPDYDDHPEPFVISGGLSTAYSVTVDVRIMFDTLYTNQGNLPISNHPTNWNNDQVFELDGLMMALR